MGELALDLHTDRHYPLRPHHEQSRLWRSKARFRVVPSGRRSGKTELAKRFVLKCALRGTAFPDARFFAAAPTRDQAKRIFWADLKRLSPSWAVASISESELCIKYINGSEIWVIGMDKPERIEGTPWDGGILDEYANMKKTAWTQNVRPALSDRLGWCWLIGVPEGRNHYYDVFKSAQAYAQRANGNGTDPEWDAFHWFSEDILPPEEIEAAKRDLDPQVYEQEYKGSFIHFTGRAYYNFFEATHTSPLHYDPKQPLVFCFDFNVAPGVAAVVQEQPLPDLDVPTDKWPLGTGVIGEVYIPRNSNTPLVCNRLIKDWGEHEGLIYVFGDSTGGAKGSAKVKGSDWDLVREALEGHFGPGRVHYFYPRANPAERARVNAVNTRLLNGAGDIRLKVDAFRAPYVVKDLEGVVVVEGGSGELDKKEDPALTHISDALGYYLAVEFPIVPRVSSDAEVV